MVWSPNDTQCPICGYPTAEAPVRGVSLAGAPATLPPNAKMIGEDRNPVLGRICGRCGNVQLRVRNPAKFDVVKERAS